MKNPHSGDSRYELPPQAPSPNIQETDFEPPPPAPAISARQHKQNQQKQNNDDRHLQAPPAPETYSSSPSSASANYGSITTSPPPGSAPAASSLPKSSRTALGTSTRSLPPDILRGLLMALMALDHTAMSLNAWPHGTSIGGENDSTQVTKWNRPAAYALRTLTHLCAPGFTFLLGMGIVYFGRSRTTTTSLSNTIPWGTVKLTQHFLVRGIVLILISELMGLVMSAGRFWVFNIVLIALAVDYFLAGVLWVLLSKMEIWLGYWILNSKVLPEREEDDASESLLRPRSEQEAEELEVAPDRKIIRAGNLAWHLCNALLVALVGVTMWWNIWLSPTGGHCDREAKPKLGESVWVRMWFYQVFEGRVLSGFPPLAWISFAIWGLVYGRVALARSWSAKATSLGNLAVGLAFGLLFVMTRLFHFGNLSEGCLNMAGIENGTGTQGTKNQYLASPAAFFYLIKYPPDVAFWAFTMAGNHLLLAGFSAIPPRIASRVFHVLLVFGTSALFFFVIHMFIAVGLGQAAIALVGHEVGRPDFMSGRTNGVDQLWAFFITWSLLLAILYPLCRWYGGFKRSKGPDSIWRFF